MAENVFLELTDGLKMPALGYGTWQSEDEEVEKGLEAALEAGYRHIDTAFIYQNEAVIGKVLNRWLTSGKIKRKLKVAVQKDAKFMRVLGEDLFIVTKLPTFGNRPEGVPKYLKKSLEALQLSYIDLYLIHAPFAFIDDGSDTVPIEDEKALIDPTTDHVAIWKEMEKQVEVGLTKAIGLSNFNAKQIQRILDSAKIPPVNLQIELHVYHQQRDLVEFCKEKDIVVTAFAPLGSPGMPKFCEQLGVKIELPDVLNLPEVQKIAKGHNKTSAQILLRYIIQKGIAAIPKSVNPDRIRENIDIFDFILNDDEMETLDGLDKGEAGRFFDFIAFNKGTDEHPEYPFKD